MEPPLQVAGGEAVEAGTGAELLVPDSPPPQQQQRKVSGGEAALASAMHELAKLTADEGEQLVSMKGGLPATAAEVGGSEEAGEKQQKQLPGGEV